MKAALDFISKDVKQYMEWNDLDFTDFESAALIYHSGLPIPEIHKRLEELAAKTKDADLRKQIMDTLSVEKEDLKAFHENTKGFVYAVLAWEMHDAPCGYFAMPELAYAHGLKLACAFGIYKYQIVGQDGAQIKKSKSYWNPYLVTETAGMRELVEECDFTDASIIVECVYDKGNICHSHVNPVFLEKYEPRKDDDNFDLLMAASDLLRIRGKF